jgi:ribosome biogenesis GTPase A
VVYYRLQGDVVTKLLPTVAWAGVTLRFQCSCAALSMWASPRSSKLAFAGSISDTAIDYLTVALSGAQLLLERYAALLVTRYKLKQMPESPTALLTEIGKRRGGLRPGGVVDLHKAAETLVHEFRAGTLGRITLEAPPG